LRHSKIDINQLPVVAVGPMASVPMREQRGDSVFLPASEN
jgi:hypothetical protein